MSSVKQDIIISIKATHMSHIVSRKKNHEFRKYLITRSVKRMWFYVSSPDQTLRYIAEVSQGKEPGKIEQEGGIGNEDFNAGLTDAKYAYEILHLYRLKQPMHISELKEAYGVSPPQRYSFVNAQLLEKISLDDQIQLF